MGSVEIGICFRPTYLRCFCSYQQGCNLYIQFGWGNTFVERDGAGFWNLNVEECLAMCFMETKIWCLIVRRLTSTPIIKLFLMRKDIELEEMNVFFITLKSLPFYSVLLSPLRFRRFTTTKTWNVQFITRKCKWDQRNPRLHPTYQMLKDMYAKAWSRA